MDCRVDANDLEKLAVGLGIPEPNLVERACPGQKLDVVVMEGRQQETAVEIDDAGCRSDVRLDFGSSPDPDDPLTTDRNVFGRGTVPKDEVGRGERARTGRKAENPERPQCSFAHLVCRASLGKGKRSL